MSKITTNPPKNYLRAAIAIVGGQENLAVLIDVAQQSISHWLYKKDGVVPAEVSVAIEKATGGKITRLDLRPDLFADFVTDRSHDSHSLTSILPRHPEKGCQIPVVSKPTTSEVKSCAS